MTYLFSEWFTNDCVEGSLNQEMFFTVKKLSFKPGLNIIVTKNFNSTKYSVFYQLKFENPLVLALQLKLCLIGYNLKFDTCSIN